MLQTFPSTSGFRDKPQSLKGRFRSSTSSPDRPGNRSDFCRRVVVQESNLTIMSIHKYCNSPLPHATSFDNRVRAFATPAYCGGGSTWFTTRMSSTATSQTSCYEKAMILNPYHDVNQQISSPILNNAVAIAAKRYLRDFHDASMICQLTLAGS